MLIIIYFKMMMLCVVIVMMVRNFMWVVQNINTFFLSNQIFINKKKKITKKENEVENPYQYRRKDYLISRAEHKFFDVLIESVGDRFYVFPQVHLATFLDHKIVGQNWKGAFRHIDEKSVDFVLCDKNDLSVLCVVELNDKSHNSKKRKDRDAFLTAACESAVLPLIQIPAQAAYNIDEIIQALIAHLSAS